MANKNKKTFTYNQAHSRGAQIAQDLQRSVAQRSADYAAPYVEGSMGAYTDVSDFNNMTFPAYTTIDKQGKAVVDTEESNSGSLGDFLLGDSWDLNKMKERWDKFSFKDMYRITLEKLYGASVDSKEKQLDDVTFQQGSLKIAQDYNNLLKYREDLINQYKAFKSHGYASKEQTRQLQNSIIKVDDQVKKYQDFFKQHKNDDVFLDLFYDTNKAGASDYLAALKDNTLVTHQQFNTNGILGTINNALKYTAGTLSEGLENIALTTWNAIGKVLPQAIGGDKNGTFIKRAIKSGTSNYDNLFEGYSTKDGSKLLQTKINALKTDLDREQSKREISLKSAINSYKNGNWLFDPKKINPEFRDLQNKNRGGLIGSIIDPTQWGYLVPEIGTSFSDAKSFAEMIATNAGGALATKAAVKFLTRKIPGLAAVLTAEDMAKAFNSAENVEQVANVLSRVKTAKKLIGGSTAIAGIYWAKQMRQFETNGEAINALAQRVLDRSYKADVDFNKVFYAVDQYSKRIGVDSKDLDQLEKVKLALAYNIPTGDDNFDKIKVDSRKGLAKLINDNNAMAFEDYLQALPFMDYTRGVISKAANNMFSRVPKMHIQDQILYKAAKSAATGVIDNAIDRVAMSKFSNIGNRLKFIHGSKYLAKKFEKAFPLATSEALEEGRQQLLTSRFTRGEYDNYSIGESSFYLPSVFDNQFLNVDAAAAYLGISSGDPDNGDAELRRSMEIGAMTGLLFRIPHSVKNILAPYKENSTSFIRSSDKYSLRNTVAQLRNDNVIRSIAANNYQLAQDNDHVGIFFEAFKRAGINRDRLQEALDDMKKYKGSLLEDGSDSYIESDKELLNAAWFAYNNKNLEQSMKDLNISRNSEDHKQLVQAATRVMVDSKNAEKDSQKARNNIHSIINKTVQDYENATQENNPALFNIINKIKQDYQKFNESINARRNQFKNSEEGKKAGQEWIDKNEAYYEDDAQITPLDKAIENVMDERDEFKVDSEKEYIQSRLESIFSYRGYKAAQKLAKDLKDQKRRLQLISNETGTDINTDKLTGMIDYLDKLIQNRKNKVENSEEILAYNEKVDLLNASISDKKKQYKKITYDSIFKDYQDFDNQDEIDKAYQAFLINDALYNVLKPMSAAFITGQVDPRSVYFSRREQNWSELSDEQKSEFTKKIQGLYQEQGKQSPTEAQIRAAYLNEQNKKRKAIKELSKKYAELRDKIEGNDDISNMSMDDISRLTDMEREAARDLISSVLADKKNRMRIARREWNQERPLTPDDVQQAEEGTADEEVTQRIKDLAGEPKSPDIEKEAEDMNVQPISQDKSVLDTSELDAAMDNSQQGSTENERNLEEALGMSPTEDKQQQKLREKQQKQKAKEEQQSDSTDFTDEKDGDNNGSDITIKTGKSQEAQQNSTDTGVQDNTDKQPEQQQVQEVEELEQKGDGNTPDLTPDKTIADTGLNVERIQDDQDFPDDNPEDSNDDIDQVPYKEGKTAQVIDPKSIDAEDTLNIENPLEQEPEVLPKKYDDNGTLNIEDLPEKLDVDIQSESDTLSNMDNPTEPTDTSGVYDDRKPKPQAVQESEDIERRYIDHTFFYRPDAEEPMDIRVNGKDVKLPEGCTIGSGAELAQKLTQKGWFEKADKFYVVSQMQKYQEGNIGDERDLFTVSLAIRDGNKIYFSALRAIGKYHYEYKKNTDVDLSYELANKLKFIGVDMDAYKVNLFETAKNYYLLHNNVDQSLLENDDKLNKKVIDWYNNLHESDPENAGQIRAYIDDTARNKSALPGKVPLTNNQVTQQIQRLRDNRNAIIEAYCTFKDGKYIIPQTIRTDVKPQEASISNGKIQTRPKLENNLVDFRPLTEKDLNLDIPSDPEKLTMQLENGTITLGYGTGVMADEGNRFLIRNLYKPSGDTIDGKGYSGKLYFTITGPSGYIVPVMLREERFNQVQDKDGKMQFIDPVNMQLAIDPNTGKINRNATLSMAELILYMVTGRINPEEFEGNQGLIVDLLALSVHTTSATKADKKHPYLASKQFYFDDENNQLVLTKPGTRQDLRLSMDQLFGDQSEKTRRSTIRYIANNLHWNTDKKYMIKYFNESMPKLSMFLRQYFEDNPKAKSYKFFGLNQLEFKRDELFSTNKNGQLNPKKVSLAAWMINNGKLLTDLAPQHFYAPFIYSDGVQASTKKKAVAKVKKESKKHENPSVIEAEANIVAKRFTDKAISRMQSRYKSDSQKQKVTKDDFLVLSDEARKEVLNNYRKRGIYDIVVIDVLKEDVEGKSLDEVKRIITQHVQKYVDYANSQEGQKFDVKNLTFVSDPMLKNIITRGYVPILNVGTNGNLRINAQDPLSILRNSKVRQDGYTGVFSRFKSKGKFDEKAARKWLSEKLGLDETKVVVLDGVLKSCENSKVYGITSLAADYIDRQVNGVITLSNEAGYGIHYHEAWHYVNLLLNNKAQRLRLYDAYIKSHNLKNITFGEVEELMAEDFRRYAEMRNGNGIVNIVKRLYNNILDFVKVSRKKDIVRNVFNAINNGQYFDVHMDKDSIKEFENRYPNGVASADYYVPTVDQSTLDKLEGIKDYHTFYQCGVALAQKLLSDYGFKTPNDINSKKVSKFNDLIEDLKNNNEFELDPLKQSIINDICNNPKAFEGIVANVFAQYGIKANVKKFSQMDETNDLTNKDSINDDDQSRDIGDRADNTWDVMQLSISKKDNVAFRAKLFLSLIEKGKFVLDPETGEREYETQFNDIISDVPLYWSYSEAWSSILKNLWMCESYDSVDPNTGVFAVNSIRGKVKQLADRKMALFVALNDKLEEIEGDIELENQILATVKSSYNQVAQIWINDPVEKPMGIMDLPEDMVSSVVEIPTDEKRTWEIRNDNTLKAKRNQPRLWSQEFASSNVIISKDSQTIINPEYVDTLVKMRQDAIDLSKVLNEPTIQDLSSAYDEAATQVVKILNYMGIPFDRETLDAYTYQVKDESDGKNPMLAQLQSLQMMLGGYMQKKNGSKNNYKWKTNKQTGSLSYFIDLLDKYKGKPYLETKQSKRNKDVVTVDQLFVGYGLKTPISKMAEVYAQTNPSSTDVSIKGPDGATLYPISENNEASDKLRHINDNKDGVVEQMMLSPYAKHSSILNIARNDQLGDRPGDTTNKFKLNAFVGIKDTRENTGDDYFGITPLADYISKMVMKHNNMLVFPTMADKKTWYSISYDPLTKDAEGKILSDGLCVHDLITYNHTDEAGKWNALRFSEGTLNRFVGYFNDELESLKQYYDRKNIAYFVNNPGRARDNFHGKINDGRMNMAGNGGMFRYFYDAIKIKDDNGKEMNLNQYLEFLYNKQQTIEKNPVKNGGLGTIREGDNELDGFELVRRYINELSDQVKSDPSMLKDGINTMLMSRVSDEFQTISDDGSTKVVYFDGKTYLPRAIPVQILDYYHNRFGKSGRVLSDYYEDEAGNVADCTLSVIANNVANEMISTIELEKVFTGDPAYYKWQYNRDVLDKFTVDGHTEEVKRLTAKDADKIKRLGEILSPGQNLRIEYSNREIHEFRDPISGKEELRGSKYTVLNINDIVARSKFINDVQTQFGRQILADEIRANPEWFDKIVEKESKESGEKLTREGQITKMYLKDNYYKSILDRAPKSVKEAVDIRSKQQMSPYEKITVSDAQVCIRPALYRKIRINLGNWTTEPDESGYSDEEAYKILETDGSWMNDPEKARKVSKLQLFPLKMTYFSNSPTELGPGIFQNLPVYNKMAIFPMFKYATQSTSGKQLYDRMNKEGNEIDMIAFESAVKVGDNQNRYSPYNKDVKIIDGDITTMDDAINNDSDQYIDRSTGEVKANTTEGNKLSVQVQDLNGIRMQLNTDAHESVERSIGTQMFKLAFSNLFDNLKYGLNKADWQGQSKPSRYGREIKADLMACINAMTMLGINKVQDRFYSQNNEGKFTHINQRQVRNLVETIVKNNGLGVSAEEIIHNGGVVASLMSRKVFEQSVFSAVSKDVIDIQTKGGSAVQQSIFGFTGFDDNNVRSYEDGDYHLLNGGREIRWNTQNGSMEVMLSINFFRPVVPQEYQKTYGMMRQWLIDHDVINGLKSEEYWNITEEQKQLKGILDAKIEDFNLSVKLLRILQKNNVYTIKDVIDKHQDYKNQIGNKLQLELKDLLDNVNLDFNTNTNISIQKAYSHPKPFGIGYRIPTQGMSSMFAMTVADVLPTQSGDTIVVPREFTAQTGSDFDVDKLFIATMSYINGELDTITEEQQKQISDIFSSKVKGSKQNAVQKILQQASYGAIQNRLLNNYIDIISDTRNFSNARASIDTITDVIKSEILPHLKSGLSEYRPSMYELTPSFQSRRKMEFSTGKDGIGPFALNVTNMALTQFTHLSMRYGDNQFGFHDLDQVLGEDGERISDWLSAMVNAHVDVAKDPYIFDLNINSSTYNHVNFLLRAGKGKATFSFIAQPILKKYGQLMGSAKGTFGKNFKADGKSQELNNHSQIYSYLLNVTRKNLADKLNLDKLYKTSGKKSGGVSYFLNEDYVKKHRDDIIDAIKKSLKSDGEKNYDVINKYAADIFNLIIGNDKQIQWKDAMNFDKGIYAIEHADSTFGLYYQMLSLRSFGKIKTYADELADLVKVSKIDTKKFGNNISSHINFKNTYEQFKYGDHKVEWYINDGNKYEQKIDEKTGEELTPTETTAALMRYFHNLFLDSKFYNSTELVQRILQNQTFSATPLYANLLRTALASLNADEQFQGYTKWRFDKDGNYTGTPYDGYKQVMKDDVVQAIGSSIESMLRFQALLDFAPKIEATDDYTGPIDFTFGGDRQEIEKNYKRILYGDKEGDEYDRNTIFQNLANLMQDIIDDPDSDEAQGLVDQDGVISNELFEYLRPQTGIKGSSVGRMMLSKTQMNVGVEQKQRLMSAFDQLLTHPSERVRRVARDLAIYAYYSTYDTNSAYSFSDIIPPKYRRQYDRALSLALDSRTRNGYQHKSLEDAQLMANDILDVIARNLYKNDDVVPMYFEDKRDIIKYEGTVLKVDGIKKKVNALLVSNSRSIPKSRYFKIKRGDQYVVYRYAGAIEGLNKENKALEIKRVYMIVPKFGLQIKGTQLYEFMQGSEGVSIFDENKLPSTFKADKLLDYAEQYANDLTESLSKDKKNGKSKQKDESKQVVMYRFSSTINPLKINGSYYEVNPNDNKLNNKVTNEDGSVEFVSAINPINKIEQDIKSSGIDININNVNLQQIVEQIQSRQSIGIYSFIHFNGDISKFEPSKKQVSDYITQKESEYEDTLASDLTKAQRRQFIAEYSKKLKDEAADALLQKNVNDKVDSIVKDLLSSNVTNFTILSTGDGVIEQAGAYSAMLNQSNITSTLGPCRVYILGKTMSNPESLETEKQKYILDDIDVKTDEQEGTEDDISMLQDAAGDAVTNIEDIQNAQSADDLLSQIEDQNKQESTPSVDDPNETAGSLDDLLSQIGALSEESKETNDNKKC